MCLKFFSHWGLVRDNLHTDKKKGFPFYFSWIPFFLKKDLLHKNSLKILCDSFQQSNCHYSINPWFCKLLVHIMRLSWHCPGHVIIPREVNVFFCHVTYGNLHLIYLFFYTPGTTISTWLNTLCLFKIAFLVAGESIRPVNCCDEINRPTLSCYV